jgi:hypothetical protein
MQKRVGELAEDWRNSSIETPLRCRIGIHRCCQTKANQSQFASKPRISGRADLTPLGESGGAVALEIIAAVEVAFLVEMVVDERVDGGEFLQTSHPPEAEHCALSSSERQV